MIVTAEDLATLRMRTSEKWTAHPPDVLPLFVAEMDYPLAPPVADAVVDRVRASDTGYVGSPGGLPAAFAGFAERRWGWRPDATSSFRTTTDVGVAIVEVLRAVAASSGVVITPPVYPPFAEFVREAGARVVEVPLVGAHGEDAREAGPGTGWALDFAGIERAFAAGARAMILCSPHNPLGLVQPRETLANLAELAARHDVTVVSDEVHAPLVHPGVAFTPFLSVSDAAREHGVAVTSASKGWNIAGLKCSLIVAASERMRGVLDGLPFELGVRTSILGLHASVAAFEHGEEWLDGAIEAIVANARLLTSLLAERLPDAGYRAPDASYLAWLDLRALGWGDDPSIHALERARVALNPGPSFGRQGRGFVRLNLACAPEVLGEAIGRLAAAR